MDMGITRVRRLRLFYLFGDLMDDWVGLASRFVETEWVFFSEFLVVVGSDLGRIVSGSDAQETELPCDPVSSAFGGQIFPELLRLRRPRAVGPTFDPFGITTRFSYQCSVDSPRALVVLDRTLDEEELCRKCWVRRFVGGPSLMQGDLIRHELTPLLRYATRGNRRPC